MEYMYGYTLSSTNDGIENIVGDDSRFETVYKAMSGLARGQRGLISEQKCILEMIEAMSGMINHLKERVDEQEKQSQIPQA